MPTRYLEWLRGLVDDLHEPHNDLLFVLLANYPFDAYMSDDLNRAEDGLELRRRFERETSISLPDLGRCSVLEFLIALAKRMNDVAWDYQNPNKTPEYFWEILNNAGIPYEDTEFKNAVFLAEIIENILHKRVAFLGDYGLFPLKASRRDQAKVSFWDQMSDYLGEKLQISDT